MDGIYDELDKFEYDRARRESREERKMKRAEEGPGEEGKGEREGKGFDADAQRKLRDREDMKAEAERLASLFEVGRRGSFEEW